MQHELRSSQLLLIDRERWETKCRLLDEFDLSAYLVANPEKSQQFDTDIYGDPLPKPYTIGETAVIPVKGVLVCGYPSIYKLFGFCDVDEVRENTIKALQNPATKRILFDVDSPGGMVRGIREFSEVVKATTKRIGVFSQGTVASGALWPVCSAYGLFGTLSSEWGSIGAYAAYTISQKAFELLGHKVTVVKSGTYKGILEPGTDLTPEQEAFLQSRIDGTGQEFRDDIKTYRPIKDEDLQGQWYTGKAAASRGFLDEIVTGIDEAITALG